jgi:uncharacterized protein YyaL (SSP411 family)
MAHSKASVPNRLIREKSPYLLQHAHNPVDWYAWGDEAFAKARSENKPILVSIGYSTCHWCHVMERESYEDPGVAELMNQYLVNIKVDREERPDVDKIYMTAVSAMTGSGGWPLNVFLTPDLKPFFGGTYFPPTARWGQPGWRDVVQQIGETWAQEEHRKRVLNVGEQVAQALKHYASSASPTEGVEAGWLEAGVESFREAFDESRGGFSGAPKFPMPVNQTFLLRWYARTQDEQALRMVTTTLEAMARGGIYDHLGGGFARYSTDAQWHLPHFEKMLYDNAQLAVNYLDAYLATGRTDFADVGRETLEYVLRDMTHPEGGFYSAEDADSLPAADAAEKREGAFYVWDQQEIVSLLGDVNGKLFSFRYGVRPEGNVLQDPHQEFPNKNVLYAAHSIPETAKEFKLAPEEVEKRLGSARKMLFDHRAQRPRPHLDDKVLTSWNGLMISAFARGAQVLNDDRYLAAAQKSAEFIRRHLYERSTGRLQRRWRDGEAQGPAIADDYAFFVQGLLDLFETDFNADWLEWAEQLTAQLLKDFEDKETGGFYMTGATDGKDLLVRVKEDTDNVEPSASSVAALNLLRLAQYRDDKALETTAIRALRAFGEQMRRAPRALPLMLAALDYHLTEPRQIVIAGNSASPDTRALLRVVNETFAPVKVVMVAEGGETQKRLSGKLPFIDAMRPVDGKAAAYVCVRHTCKQPVTDAAALRELLSAR